MSDPDDESQPDRSTRTRPETWRRERSNPPDDDREAPVNPEWRNARISRSAAGRRGAGGSLFPASPQDIPTWLQEGGWRIVTIAAAVLVLLLIALLWFRNPPGALQTAGEEVPTTVSEAAAGAGAENPFIQPSITPEPQPTSPPAQTAFVVSGTDGQGLFLRADHDSAAQVLETLPDGTRVEQIGEDFPGPDRVWRNVRGPSGQEGWVAVDWLQPAP